jgi:hypothetical protein
LLQATKVSSLREREREREREIWKEWRGRGEVSSGGVVVAEERSERSVVRRPKGVVGSGGEEQTKLRAVAYKRHAESPTVNINFLLELFVK